MVLIFESQHSPDPDRNSFLIKTDQGETIGTINCESEGWAVIRSHLIFANEMSAVNYSVRKGRFAEFNVAEEEIYGNYKGDLPKDLVILRGPEIDTIRPSRGHGQI